MLLQNHGGEEGGFQTVRAAMTDHPSEAAERGAAVRLLVVGQPIQVALNAVYDIRVLFLIDHGPSDAATMARLFLLPAWFWATLWMLISITMLAATLWGTRPRRL